jgi:hypothetical protein
MSSLLDLILKQRRKAKIKAKDLELLHSLTVSSRTYDLADYEWNTFNALVKLQIDQQRSRSRLAQEDTGSSLPGTCLAACPHSHPYASLVSPSVRVPAFLTANRCLGRAGPLRRQRLAARLHGRPALRGRLGRRARGPHPAVGLVHPRRPRHGLCCVGPLHATVPRSLTSCSRRPRRPNAERLAERHAAWDEQMDRLVTAYTCFQSFGPAPPSPTSSTTAHPAILVKLHCKPVSASTVPRLCAFCTSDPKQLPPARSRPHPRRYAPRLARCHSYAAHSLLRPGPHVVRL